MMRGIRLAILALGLMFGAGAASADQAFRIEWAAEAGAKGPLISGYIYNNKVGLAADRMRLQIERLDAAGRVVGTSTTWVLGGVPPGSRAYFSALVETAAAYRIQVLSFDWIRGGG